MPGTQQVDNKCHGNLESNAPSPAKGSLILFYSPPERRWQTLLTCHQTQTQEPEETTSSDALSCSLEISRLLRRHPCPQRESSSGHGLLCPGHSSPCPSLQGTGRAIGLSCGQGTSHTHKWLCLVLASSPHPPLSEALQGAETRTGR